MRSNPRLRLGPVLSGVAALGALFGVGCSQQPDRPAGVSKDRAFISYRPAAEGSSQPRLAVKDLIDVKGEVTTAGSKALALQGRPATKDAACLQIARERGVSIVGKTNLAEFAASVSGVNDYYGTPKSRKSQWRRRVPGGSSSGSAVAVANGEADIAFGTDSGGSVRVPAACSGVAGLKTTHGLISLAGVYPVSPEHLDTVGPLARDTDGLVQGMDLLQRGFAGKYANAMAARPTGKSIRVGRLYLPGASAQIDGAVDHALRAAGFEVVTLSEVFRDEWKQAEKDGMTIAEAGIWIHNRQYEDSPDVSARAKATLLLGKTGYPDDYRAAIRNKAAWQRTLRRVFREVDFIALPTLQARPPSIKLFGDSLLLEAAVLSIQNTMPVNFAGNPALAIPVPLEPERRRQGRNGPLTSLQLVGPMLSEAELLNAGRLIEAARP